MYKVILHKDVFKSYKKQDRVIQKRLSKSFETLKVNPCKGANIKKLSGELSPLYRIRIGNLRVLYEVYPGQKIVRVKALGSRGDIYKK